MTAREQRERAETQMAAAKRQFTEAARAALHGDAQAVALAAAALAALNDARAVLRAMGRA